MRICSRARVGTSAACADMEVTLSTLTSRLTNTTAIVTSGFHLDGAPSHVRLERNGQLASDDAGAKPKNRLRERAIAKRERELIGTDFLVHEHPERCARAAAPENVARCCSASAMSASAVSAGCDPAALASGAVDGVPVVTSGMLATDVAAGRARGDAAADLTPVRGPAGTSALLTTPAV